MGANDGASCFFAGGEEWEAHAPSRAAVNALVHRSGRASAPGSTRVGARGSGCEAQPDAREGACAPHFRVFSGLLKSEMRLANAS